MRYGNGAADNMLSVFQITNEAFNFRPFICTFEENSYRCRINLLHSTN